MKARILIVAVLLVSATAAGALDPREFEDPALEARYRQLVAELRCVVCQNQTLAESNAPLAVDLRNQVRLQLEAGASDREVVRYLTARYGDFVLYRPPFNAVTALLWLSPLLLLAIGGGFAWRALSGPAPASRRPSEAERARARALLEGRDE